MDMQARLTGLHKETSGVWLPFSNFVQKHFDAAEVHIPEKVYHYTREEAARSIYNSGEFWIFNIFEAAANESQQAGRPDDGEVVSGIDIICEEINTIFKRRRDDNFREFADHFISDMKTQHWNVAGVYTFCMSLAPNRYLWEQINGSPGCIEIPEQLLYALCGREPIVENNKSNGKYIPGIVCYDKDRLLDKIRPFLYRAAKALAEGARRYRRRGPEYIDCVKQKLIWELGVALLAFSQTYKDKAFSDENEIRLLNIVRHPFTHINEAIHNGRRHIIEHVGSNMLRLCLEPPTH